MKLPLWTDEAQIEAREAAEWYYEQDPLLGERFEAAIQYAITMVVEAPMRWPVVRDRIHRRLVVERFPYSLIYRILDGHKVLLVALRHHGRRPEPRFLQ